jgi:diguanylate cyclase (GGDEF)-like protein
MSEPAKNSLPTAASSIHLEQQLRAKVEALNYLPTTAAVALKFVEMGKDAEADPAEYTKVISSDSSLSSKLLSLSNSSWFGVRNKVTKIQVAVNLLGLGTVRTLAISYCVTGLHHQLRLSAQESRLFWAASLCKAVAAKQFAAYRDPRLAEEAFAAGLFQDFALPVMFSAGKDQVLAILQDATLDTKARLQKERAAFHLDHAEVGRSIAQKLELPDLFVDAIAFHHNAASLGELLGKPIIADATYAASLFPHLPDIWNRQDALELQALLGSQKAPIDANQFLDSVQQEFNQLYAYFEQGDPPEGKLADLLIRATAEAADTTTRLVNTVQTLMQQAASAGSQVHQLLKQHNQLEEAASRDALTNALNRQGFSQHANDLLAQATRYGMNFAVAYLDVDQFKKLNDSFGHATGDVALQAVVASAKHTMRQTDVIGRLGGDEFALLLSDCSEHDAVSIVQRLLDHVASQQVTQEEGQSAKVTLSAGLVWVKPSKQPLALDKLLSAADLLMYQAKRAGGNRVQLKSLQPTEKAA